MLPFGNELDVDESELFLVLARGTSIWLAKHRECFPALPVHPAGICTASVQMMAQTSTLLCSCAQLCPFSFKKHRQAGTMAGEGAALKPLWLLGNALLCLFHMEELFSAQIPQGGACPPSPVLGVTSLHPTLGCWYASHQKQPGHTAFLP